MELQHLLVALVVQRELGGVVVVLIKVDARPEAKEYKHSRDAEERNEIHRPTYSSRESEVKPFFVVQKCKPAAMPTAAESQRDAAVVRPWTV